MNSPIESILLWYKALGQEQKSEVGRMVGAWSPGFDDIDLNTESEFIEERFVRTLEKSCENPSSEIGMFLSVKASIEFFVVRKYGGDWEQSRDFYRAQVEKDPSSGFRDDLNQSEFRERKWREALGRWRSSCSGIGDSDLNKYLLLVQ